MAWMGSLGEDQPGPVAVPVRRPVRIGLSATRQATWRLAQQPQPWPSEAVEWVMGASDRGDAEVAEVG
jgi:hypothetical protein